MEKEVGILTYHSSDNFGSVLQAYALSRYLSERKADCEIIDYRKREVQQLYRIFQPFDSRYHVLTNLYSVPYYGALQARKKSFEAFRTSMLPLSKVRYREKEELKRCRYTRYIVGSDQVWNMDIVDFDLSYMLDFTDADKISYGASFGPRGKSREALAPVVRYLQAFRKISVREELSKELCEKKMGIPAVVVCDPVFLLTREEWKRAAATYAGRPNRYLVGYFPGGMSFGQDACSKALAKEQGCERVLLMPEWRNAFRAGRKAYDCGPAEFLDLLLHADVVCTSSFHGTAFSILLGKEAFVSLNDGDSRIRTLLRYIPEQLIDYRDDTAHVLPCDFSAELQNLIDASKQFLEDAICCQG